MSLVAVNDSTVTSCAVQIPAWGIWWADVELDEPTVLAGSVTLSLPGLSLVGTIMSGGEWQGRARYRIAGGAGQWGKTLIPLAYSNDMGIPIAAIIADAAESCGETFDPTGVAGTVGPAWVRAAGPAARTLELLAPRAWYVDIDGVTRLGARAAAQWGGEGTVTLVDEAASVVELAADDLAGLVPGAIVEGPEAVDVRHTLRDGVLRTTLWGERGASSRLGSSLARLVAMLTSDLRFRGLWSYRVIAQSGESLDLQPERGSSGMPILQRVRPRYGVPGASAEHTLGSMVLVAFVDGDPAKPVVVAGDDPDAPGFVPAEIHLGTALGHAVRYGESVTVGAAAGVITFVLPLAPDTAESVVLL